jgi:hypothetical protein
MLPFTTGSVYETGTRAKTGALAAAGRGVFLSFVAIVLSVITYGFVDAWAPKMSLAVLFGVLTSVFVIVFGSRTKLGGRAAGIMGLATLGWLPEIFLVLAFLREPIVTTHWKCGTGLACAMMIALFATIPLLVLSSCVARGAAYPALDRWLRAAALFAVVIVALATTVGLARMHRPDPDSYVASLPIVRVLGPGDSFVTGDGTKVTYRRKNNPGLACPESGVPGHDRQVFDQRNPPRCVVEGIEGAVFGGAFDCEPLTLRHDAKEDVWIAKDDSTRETAFAIKGSELRSRDIQIADVARSIAPPTAWTLGGLIGCVLGGVLFVSGVRLERRRASFDAIEGILREDGWVTLAGRPPLKLCAAGAPGPVVLWLRGESPASYREAGGGTVETWRPGTLELARAELQGLAASRYALALTSALLCAAPLLLSGLGGSR